MAKNIKSISGLSAIVPYRDQPDMTIACLESISSYSKKYISEIIVVNNNSNYESRAAINEFIHKASKRNGLEYKHVDYPKPFNFQKINNWAVQYASHDTILFLNNDTELVDGSAALIENMYRKAQEKSVGAVGCLLLYEDQKHIQHAGVYLENGAMAAHFYQREDFTRLGAGHPVYTTRKLTAVTAACLMVKKEKFLEVGGYDESFTIGGGDVDLCIRLNQKGYNTWYVAPTKNNEYILHKESISRVGIKLPFKDYVRSYQSYIKGLSSELVDPYA